MDREHRWKISQALMGNQHAKGHGGKGRRTDRHYTAPHVFRVPIELDRILDRIHRIGGEQ